MNFVKIIFHPYRKFHVFQICFVCIIAAALFFCTTGCNGPVLSSSHQIREFEKGGPPIPEVDAGRLIEAKIPTGYYRVVSGDLLEIQLPPMLRNTYTELPQTFERAEPYLRRVNNVGTITLPIIGEVSVADKKLVEIESLIVDKYYPTYVTKRPAVVCEIAEYQTETVTVSGGVKEPGIYSLQSNEMSLVSLLMKAGGIVESGASTITIERPNTSETQEQFSSSTGLSSSKVSPVSSESIQENASSDSMKHLIVTSQRKVLYSWGADLANEKNETSFEKKFDEFIEEGQIFFFFQVDNLSDTKGDLAISRGRKVLYSAKIDIVSGKERQTFAEEVAKSYPSVQASDVLHEIEYIAESHAIEQLTRKMEQSNIARFEQDTLNAKPTTGSNNFDSELIVLPVKGLNIPFADVVLHDGDIVEVKKLNKEIFTVIGHVNKAGAFPYPPDAEYNLTHAVSFAAGIDLVADPQYVSIYRRAAGGRVVSATFGINEKSLARAYSVMIKPGDVISVEVTPCTRTNLLIAKLLHVNVGVYVNPFDYD